MFTPLSERHINSPSNNLREERVQSNQFHFLSLNSGAPCCKSRAWARANRIKLSKIRGVTAWAARNRGFKIECSVWWRFNSVVYRGGAGEFLILQSHGNLLGKVPKGFQKMAKYNKHRANVANIWHKDCKPMANYIGSVTRFGPKSQHMAKVWPKLTNLENYSSNGNWQYSSWKKAVDQTVHLLLSAIFQRRLTD